MIHIYVYLYQYIYIYIYVHIYIYRCIYTNQSNCLIEPVETNQSKRLWFRTGLWFCNQALQHGPPHRSVVATLAEAARCRVPKHAGAPFP